MIDYCAYIVGADGSFKSSQSIAADGDEQALKIAEMFVDEHDVELWRLDRKVGVLSAKDSSSSE